MATSQLAVAMAVHELLKEGGQVDKEALATQLKTFSDQGIVIPERLRKQMVSTCEEVRAGSG